MVAAKESTKKDAGKTPAKRTQKPRGPSRKELLERIEGFEVMEGEYQELQKQAQMLAGTPPILFAISVNRMTGLVGSVPTLDDEMSVGDLRWLLKGLNAFQQQALDRLASLVQDTIKPEGEESEEGSEEGDESSEETPEV